MSLTREQLLMALSNWKTVSTGHLTKFKERFEKHPTHAFRWADEAFAAAARVDLFERLITIFSEVGDHQFETRLQEIQGWLQDRMAEKARNSSQSSSMAANIMEREELGAVADVLDRIKYLR